MAITTYAELQTAVDNWLINAYDDNRVKEFIALGEAQLNRKLRVRDMETSADLTLTAGTRTVALPTRYRETRRLYINTDPVRKLDFVPPADYWMRYMSAQTSKPVAYTIEADDYLFGPVPDTGYTVKCLYYAGFEALSDSVTSNDLLTNNPDAYLFASLAEAWRFKGEPQYAAYWAGEMQRVIDEMHGGDERDRISGAPIRQRSAQTVS